MRLTTTVAVLPATLAVTVDFAVVVRIVCATPLESVSEDDAESDPMSAVNVTPTPGMPGTLSIASPIRVWTSMASCGE